MIGSCATATPASAAATSPTTRPEGADGQLGRRAAVGGAVDRAQAVAEDAAEQAAQEPADRGPGDGDRRADGVAPRGENQSSSGSAAEPW